MLLSKAMTLEVMHLIKQTINSLFITMMIIIIPIIAVDDVQYSSDARTHKSLQSLSKQTSWL